MTQYEYKVVKARVVDQNYYTSWLAAYGWQVQSMQEVVDQVVNQSLQFSHNTGNSSSYGRAYFHPHTNSASFYGNQHSYGWGSNMGTSITQVKTKLTITFFRDVQFPDRDELNVVESQWWKCSERYLAKLIDRGNTKDEEKWPELIELKRIQTMAWAIRNRKKSPPSNIQQKPENTPLKPKQVEYKPVQIPNTPASATIHQMEVTYNAIQSGQPGIQIRLSFDIQHRKGYTCGVLAYFKDALGNGLIDLNNKFKTSSGHVCVGSSCSPDFEDALFNDYILFLPYEELDQPDGKRDLQFNVQIYDDIGKVFIAISEMNYFTFFKEGSKFNGNSLERKKEQITSTNEPKAATKPPKFSEPVTMPKATSPLPSKEERMRSFAQSAGWTDITEDRKLYMEGIFLSTEGKPTAAMKNFKQALQLEPMEDRYWSALSMALANQGKIEESILLIKDGLSRLPESFLLKADLGYRYISKKDFLHAETIAEELEKSTQPHARYQAWMIKACSAEQQGKYREAISHFDRADAQAGQQNPLLGLGQQRCREMMKQKR